MVLGALYRPGSSWRFHFCAALHCRGGGARARMFWSVLTTREGCQSGRSTSCSSALWPVLASFLAACACARIHVDTLRIPRTMQCESRGCGRIPADNALWVAYSVAYSQGTASLMIVPFFFWKGNPDLEGDSSDETTVDNPTWNPVANKASSGSSEGGAAAVSGTCWWQCRPAGAGPLRGLFLPTAAQLILRLRAPSAGQGRSR